jgi:hypothetical protein
LKVQFQLSCLLAAALMPVLSWAAESHKPAVQSLAAALTGARSSLAIQNGELVGPGSADLVRRARIAQFVLVGEDHGFAEVPAFVIALKRTLGADAPAYLVAEVGPLSAAKLTQASRDGAANSVELHYPGAVPFFGWRDDLAMFEAWQQGSVLPAVWGIDQEFILSTRMHLERLAMIAPPAGRASAEHYLARAVEADRALLAEHDPSVVLLPQLGDADFRSLRIAFDAHDGDEAGEILAELAESASIYRGQSQDGADSNAQRAVLMKRHFMRYYHEALRRDGRPPRALFRLGAFHAGRGLSPINQFDIGNLASELAASNGSESLHILVVMRGGHVNKWLPFLADTASRNSTYDAHSELAQIGAAPFIDHTAGDAWNVFDMTPLRHSAAARKAGGTLFERLVFAYDYVVVVPEGHAAVNYSGG